MPDLGLGPLRFLKSLPSDWELIGAADTGTYMSAVFVAICPDPYCVLALAEFPNYEYISNELELTGISVPEWARWVHRSWNHLRPATKVKLWADLNTQFRAELQHYDIHLMPNLRGPELRTEIAREYMSSRGEDGRPNRALLAPWLKILPYEIEHAKWPDETTGAGKFQRIKQNDHTLDGWEHCLSRRPRARHLRKEEKKSFLQRMLDQYGRPDRQRIGGDPHLGRL